MTEQELRKSVVSIMKGWLGCKEADGSHKKIIDIYNSHKPLARGYKVKYTDEWCATTVSAAFIVAGLTDIAPTECSCAQMIELYKKIGRWKESDAYKPKVGDIIMYDWEDDGRGDNKGNPNHVGIVAEISGSTMKIIEGNKKEAVAYRSLQVDGKYIRGYCLPDYKAQAQQPAWSNAKVDPAKSYLKKYAKNYTVTASGLNMRRGAGTGKGIIKVLREGDKVNCYGYYTLNGPTVWLYVKASDGTVGYCSKNYLK